MARRFSLFRRRRRGFQPGSLLLLGVLGLLLVDPRLLMIVGSAALVVCALRWATNLLRRRQLRRALRQLELHQVDAMDPLAFEAFVAELMEAQGFRTELTPIQDTGVDVVASQGARRIAVQVKRYSKPVDASAMGEALVGMPHYGCNECMVVTNSTFTRPAVKAAAPHPCTLIDRQQLALWVQEARKQTQ